LQERRRPLRHANPLLEGERLFTICNACRYCEGYCAVFPAMERHATFTAVDIRQLANLCHNCAECYYACQYAPPHEFAVNLPKTLAEVRLESYEHYAWPRAFAPAFRKNGLVVSLLTLCVFAAAIFLSAGLHSASGGDFYAAIPHEAMVAMFGTVSLFVAIALAAGFFRFWKESGGGRPGVASLRTSIGEALSLKYLSSGGAGCTYPDEHHSQARRWFHHFTFYGFALCFAATSVAAIYHYAMGWRAPYGYFSLPVVLGSAGGLGLLIGPAGLFSLKLRRDPAIGDARQSGMDAGFLVLLFVTSATGLALLALRENAGMPVLLVIHLAAVMALFVTLPYGKFVHSMYRWAALLRDADTRPSDRK
jgi:citrate/tricarballylate utilization protein